MENRIYKSKYRLNIQHSFGKAQAPHKHTLEMFLYIERTEGAEALFEENDQFLSVYFKRFENRYINELPEFETVLPTIENIGYLFYSELKEQYREKGGKLLKFEISEIPSRVYTISDFLENGSEAQEITPADKRLEQYVNSYLPLVNWRIRDQKNIEELKRLVETRKQEEAKREEETNTLYAAALEEKPQKPSLYWIPAAVFLALLSSIGMILTTALTGVFPMGDDVYLYLGKADYFYRQLMEGHFFPVFMDAWYNGYQMFTTSAPLPYAILAALQWVSGGNPMIAYLLFLALVNFTSLCGFMRLGMKTRGFWSAVGIGMLWMFLPENLRAVSVDGNIPYMVFMMLLPHLAAELYGFYMQKKKRYLAGIFVITGLFVLTQPYTAFLLLAGMLIVFLLYRRGEGAGRTTEPVAAAVILAVASAAPWLYPAIKNGVLSNMTFSKESFAFGGVALGVILFGCLFAQAESRKLFSAAALLALLAYGTGLPIAETMPIGEIVFNTCYATVAYMALCLGMAVWNRGKKSVKFALWALLLLGCMPGTYRLIKESTGQSLYEQQVEEAKENGLLAAMELTDRRMILLGLGEEVSFPAYYAQTCGKQINFSYDLSNHGAVIEENLRLLNYALYGKKFDYLFDRCLSMGNDTVVIKKKGLEWQKEREPLYRASLLAAAGKAGYELTDEDSYSYIFHRELPEQVGIRTNYTGISIGTNSAQVTILFPFFKEGTSVNLEDYTLEELLKYKLVFLSGFEYNNTEKAEALVRELAKNGVRVYVDMNGVPENPATNRKTFLEVTAQVITFKEKFPQLILKNQVYNPIKFYKEYASWGTVYLENVQDMQGYVWVDNKPLCFFGTTDGVSFLGFDLLAHALESEDAQTNRLLEVIFDEAIGTTPVQELIEISYQYDGKTIRIWSPEDAVNTTLAYQNTFLSGQRLGRLFNLLEVNAGETVIYFGYEGMETGIVLAAAVWIIALFWYLARRREKRKQKIL